jgi:hypothetical protein
MKGEKQILRLRRRMTARQPGIGDDRGMSWFALTKIAGRVRVFPVPGGLMQLRRVVFRVFVLCLFFVGYAATPQTPQTRPAPGGGSPGGGDRPGQPGGGNRPGPGGGGNGNRPQPGRPNPGGPQIQPVRPNPGGNRPQPGRPNPGNRPNPPRPNPRPPVRPPNRPGPGRPPSWGRPPASRPSYGWRPNDRSWLHRYYLRNLAAINLATRPRFVVGGFFPYAYIPYITPAPAAVLGYLPPVPPGYQIGYYDGYVVVYDPMTYFIANVIDLMQ